MDDNKWMNLLSDGQTGISKVLSCNQYTKKFGVTLSNEEAMMLLASRKNNLKEQERVEFGEGVLTKLIYAFCDSAYIFQDNYADTIEALQDIFYLYKNESLDELTDDELIEYMKKHFEGECQGSLEHLEDTCLEKFARCIRSNCRGFIGKYEDDEEFEEEEEYE